MTVRLNKINVSFGFSFFAAAAFFLAGDMMNNYLMAIVFSSLHEAGHIAAIRLCGRKTEKIAFGIMGIRIDKKHVFLSYGQECFVALSGPLINLLFCIIFALTDMPEIFFSVNTGLFFVNILPLRTLDGGRFIYNLLMIYISERDADKIMNFIEILALFFLVTILAVSLLKKIINLSFILFVIILVLSIIAELIMTLKKKK